MNYTGNVSCRIGDTHLFNQEKCGLWMSSLWQWEDTSEICVSCLLNLDQVLISEHADNNPLREFSLFRPHNIYFIISLNIIIHYGFASGNSPLNDICVRIFFLNDVCSSLYGVEEKHYEEIKLETLMDAISQLLYKVMDFYRSHMPLEERFFCYILASAFMIWKNTVTP